VNTVISAILTLVAIAILVVATTVNCVANFRGVKDAHDSRRFVPSRRTTLSACYILIVTFSVIMVVDILHARWLFFFVAFVAAYFVARLAIEVHRGLHPSGQLMAEQLRTELGLSRDA